MKSTLKNIVFGVGLVAILAGSTAVTAKSRHKFCVPQGTKLGSSCQTKGYAKGAQAHFKADTRAEQRARRSHPSAKE